MADSGIAGYQLYCGGASRQYTNRVDAGTATESTVSNLTAGATYFFAITAYNSLGLESAYSSELSYTMPASSPAAPPTPPQPPPTLPAPWLAADIGSPGTIGKATLDKGAYSVSGAGRIGGTSDNFRFIYQTLTGDGEIRAQLKSVQNTGANGFAGVMMRETLATNSKWMVVGIRPSGNARAGWRSATGRSAHGSGSRKLKVPNAWVRLLRKGNTFTFYTSTNGVKWSRIARQNINMAASAYFGLVVASGTTALNDSTLTQVIAVP